MISRYTRTEMGALWSDETKFRFWKDVEVALVAALEETGVAPKGAAPALSVQPVPTPERVAELERTLDHDVIAFLTALVDGMGEERRWVHFGMTSSDLLDTAQALRVAESVRIIASDLDGVIVRVRDLAERYKKTPSIGRTHGVHAEPMTIGLKFLNWYAELVRQKERLERAAGEMRVGKLSGAVGTCAHLSPDLEVRVLAKLGLDTDPVSTQVVSRDRHASLMATLALIGGSIERFATEIRHLQRTEVRELQEGFRKGQKGSSAMTHKKNPITCERLAGLSRVLRANAHAAMDNMALWHERDITHSSVERVILPDSLCLTDYVLHRFDGICERLVVDEDRLAHNLELTRGLIFSGKVLLELTRAMGSREEAYAVVQRHAMQCWEEGGHLAERLKNDPDVVAHLDARSIDMLFDLGSALRYVDDIFKRTLG